jgi:hypothetical protein
MKQISKVGQDHQSTAELGLEQLLNTEEAANLHRAASRSPTFSVIFRDKIYPLKLVYAFFCICFAYAAYS